MDQIIVEISFASDKLITINHGAVSPKNTYMTGSHFQLYFRSESHLYHSLKGTRYYFHTAFG